MRRLICAFVVRIGQKQVFSWRGSFVRVSLSVCLSLSLSLSAVCVCVCVFVWYWAADTTDIKVRDTV